LKQRRVLLAIVIALTVVVAGCGKDDNKKAKKAAGTATTAAAGDLTLDQPVKIVLLAEKKGESPAAIPNFFDGASLAIADLNSKGGVGGHPVDMKTIPAPLDPARAENALLQAFDEKPAGIIGLPASAQVVPLAPKIVAGGVPVVLLSAAGTAFKGAQAQGSWAFSIRPRNSGVAADVGRFVMDDLKAKKIGLICVNNPFGTTGCDAAEKVVKDKGATIVARRTNEASATDLTEQVLAMKGVDAVIDFNFPNPLGVVANQLVQNGIKAKHADGASSGLAVASGSVKGEAATNLYGVDDCVPTEDTRPAARQFSKAFKAKFGYDPDYAAAEAYDSVMLLAEAAKQARSNDPTQVAAALRSLSYEGLCDPNYKSDSEQILHHQSYFLTFTANGERKVVRRFTVPDPGSSATTTTTG
jgi:branched-chain amino acid transport system substrate-binding protein